MMRKAVVADREAAFSSSADFTPTALVHNIAVGL